MHEIRERTFDKFKLTQDRKMVKIFRLVIGFFCLHQNVYLLHDNYS